MGSLARVSAYILTPIPIDHGNRATWQHGNCAGPTGPQDVTVD